MVRVINLTCFINLSPVLLKWIILGTLRLALSWLASSTFFTNFLWLFKSFCAFPAPSPIVFVFLIVQVVSWFHAIRAEVLVHHKITLLLSEMFFICITILIGAVISINWITVPEHLTLRAVEFLLFWLLLFVMLILLDLFYVGVNITANWLFSDVIILEVKKFSCLFFYLCPAEACIAFIPEIKVSNKIASFANKPTFPSLIIFPAC